MNKQTSHPILKFGSLLTLAAVMQPESTLAQQQPNILFILADDHSREAISAYDGINAALAPTPNIDAIAENGVLFNNMICTNSISGPSRACLLTGKYSTTHGFYQNEGGIIFDNTQETYHKILHENGYTTALFGKWHLYSDPAGFDYYKIHGNPGQQGTYWDPLYNENGELRKEKGYATTLTTNSMLNWMEEDRDPNKPFCVMLHYKAPHRPWEPDSCYLNLFDDVRFPHPATFNDDYSGRELTAGQSMGTIENHISRGDLKQTPPEGLTQKERNQWLWWGGSGKEQFWTPDESLQGEELKDWKFQTFLKNYLRVVRSVDDQVGRVVEYLKANDLYDNTIIVYMGDQGFFLGEHGFYDKRWMYEEAIQMPCLVSYPNGIKRAMTLEELSLNVDIAPTLLDFAGIESPEEMHGESLKPIIENNKKAKKEWRKSVYYQYFEYPKWHNVQPHYGVRTDRYKLIHFYYNVDVWEFYDMERDPNEVSNQIDNPKYKKIIKELKAELTQLQQQYNDDMTLDERRELTDRYMLKYDE